MRSHVPTLAVLGAAGLFTALAPTAAGAVGYYVWVNGFGRGYCTYKLSCNSGPLISGTSTNPTGSVTCPDSSNSLTWSFGAWWHLDVQAIENKSPSGSRTSAMSTDGGMNNGTQTTTGYCNAGAETHVLEVSAVLRSQLPENLDASTTIADLVSQGFVNPADVLWTRTFTGPSFTPVNEEELVGLSVSPEDITIFVNGDIRPAVPQCDTIDFNNDGFFPDTADIDDFLMVFSGGPCTNDPNCSDIDFNNDGLFPDTLDLDSLLSVFSGGPCV